MADAAALKEEGNTHFKAGRYAEAVAAYTKCLEVDPKQHLVLSNRSAAYLKLGNSEELSLKDAEACVELAPEFTKGYSRQAAALQALKRWADAVAICEKGLAKAPDDALRKMRSECKNKHLADQLRGPWHGAVSPDLGGYDQEMEFTDNSTVRVSVFGRGVEGTFWVDAEQNPAHLSVQVPMPEAPPGMPPPPPVPYIVKLDDKGLHLCCPSKAFETRPTSFDGPGYCLMHRGKLGGDDSAASIQHLSVDEKLVLCAQELLDALPDEKLEELSPMDSDEVGRQKLMAHVKVESSMFAVKNKFGEELLITVMSSAKGDARPPAALEKSSELQKLKEKLAKLEAPDEAPRAAAAAAAAAAASAASANSRQEPGAVDGKAKEMTTKSPEKKEKAEEPADLRPATNSSLCAIATILTAGSAVALGVFLTQQNKKR